MKGIRKNLFLGMIVVAASVTGYFLQKSEQQSYVLELGGEAGIVNPAIIEEDKEAAETAATVSPEVSEQQFDKQEDKININTAPKEELDKIPGIGEVKAERIIKYRTEVGKFEVIEDIMKVKGIGTKTFENMKDYITVE